MSVRLSEPECARWLDVDGQLFAKLVADGMPRDGDGYDPYRVAEWIERTGRGQRAEMRGVVATLKQVASAFGVSYHTVWKLWRPDGMPGEKGHYDLAEIAAWKRLRLRDPGAVAGDQPEDTALLRKKRAAEARIKEAEAERKELEIREARGGMLPREDVERVVSEMILATRATFERVPIRFGQFLPAEQRPGLVAELERLVAEALLTMADWRLELAGVGQSQE